MNARLPLLTCTFALALFATPDPIHAQTRPGQIVPIPSADSSRTFANNTYTPTRVKSPHGSTAHYTHDDTMRSALFAHWTDAILYNRARMIQAAFLIIVLGIFLLRWGGK